MRFPLPTAFLLVLTVFVTASCTSSVDCDRLHRADALVDSDPGEALQILDSVDVANLHSEEMKARFGLLRFMAEAKTSYLPKTDSLLIPALDYYERKSSPGRYKMLSHFFHAFFLQNKGKQAEAVREYDKAIESGLKISDNLYVGLAYQNKGCISADNFRSEEELQDMAEGLSFLLLTNDTLHIITGHINLGMGYFHNEDFRNASVCYETALKLGEIINDSLYVMKASMLLAASDVAGGNVSRALSIYEGVESRHPDLLSCEDMGYFSEVLIQSGDLKKAAWYLEKMRSNLDNPADSTHWHLRKLHLNSALSGQTDLAGGIDSIFISSNNAVSNALNSSLQSDHNKILHEELDSLSRSNHRKTGMTIAAMAIAILAVVVSFIIGKVVISRKQRRINSQKESLLNLKAALSIAEKSLSEKEKALSEKEDALESSQNEKSGWEEKLISVRIATLTTLQDCNRMISAILSEDPKKYKGEAKALLISLQSNLAEKCSSELSLKRTETYLDNVMEGIISHINAEFSLRDKERMILLYTLAGFNYKAIATIAGGNAQSVSSTRSRLLHKIMASASTHQALYRTYLSEFVR